MPPRLVIVAIVIFWLAASAWLFQREIWPRLRTGEPPPFTIELADEAIRSAPRIGWRVFRGTKRLGTVQTWTRYHAEDDTFELHSQIPGAFELGTIGPLLVQASRASSMYRISRDGSLKAIVTEGILTVPGLNVEVRLSLQGSVDGNLFIPRGRVAFGDQVEVLELPSVPVSRQGSVLNPMHPVNRIRGLRKGQYWQVPLVDPLRDSLLAMLRKNPAAQIVLPKETHSRLLRAEVLPQSRSIIWWGDEVMCLVVEYQSDDLAARTFVRESDGLVLRQEATSWGDTLVMEREK